ncbi:MAG: translesion error-prone DNA polymerase V autoproteolytic subunit [bacterium]|nr:translesion error-prone DNA polymerase V autoproteolytic subunit [bacterium]
MEKKIAKIADFYGSHHRMPTYSELAKLLGYKTKSAVYYFVQKLIDEGVLTKDKTGKLIPKNLGELKVLGLVEAGFPSGATELIMDTMSLDEYLVENKEATYILKVKGDSMINAGIHPGDLVIVERGKPAKPGQIVIANIDGEYTLKYYRVKNRKPYLEAANEKYKDIYPENDLKIEAVVKAIIRKY